VRTSGSDDGIGEGGAGKTSDDDVMEVEAKKEQEEGEQSDMNFYLVRSASSPNARFHDALGTQVYEVRTASWNCSCPAFAFACFPATASDSDSIASADMDGQELYLKVGEQLGSLQKKRGQESMAMCKHLLACVLVERVDGLRELAEVRKVAMEEMAGWAAGWGG